MLDDPDCARGVSKPARTVDYRHAITQAYRWQEPSEKPARKARERKVTPAIRDYILGSRGFSPADIVASIAEKFGVCLSAGTVYKVWRGQ